LPDNTKVLVVAAGGLSINASFALELLSIDGDSLFVHELKCLFRGGTTHVLLTSGLVPFALWAAFSCFKTAPDNLI